MIKILLLVDESSRLTNKLRLNTMKKQRRGLNRCNVLQSAGNPKTVQQHHWKSGAKEEHQLSPGGPSNRRKLRSQPTKMNSFGSGPSLSPTPDPPACILKSAVKLTTVIGLITKHADCRITFRLYPIRL